MILGESFEFPSPNDADEIGIVAFGGDLHPDRIFKAYKEGIFPWFESDESLAWWSPDPRMILFLDKLKVSKSFKAFLRKTNYKVTFNKDFEFVINSCANIKRIGQNGTWITKGLIDSFTQLHKTGKVISVEVWDDDEIVGGLYGIDLGDIFCGESMFSIQKNASKISMAYLAAHLIEGGFEFIDTQFYSEHLKQFGTKKIMKSEYLKLLSRNRNKPKIFPLNISQNILEYFN